MKAAVYGSTGSAREVQRVEEVDRPEPGEVQVRVFGSGVNPTDLKSRSGMLLPIDRLQIVIRTGAGVIEVWGESVDPSRTGERVWLAVLGRPWGTAAEYTVFPARQAVPPPGNASFEPRASLGTPTMTAHRALLSDGPRFVEVALGPNLKLDLAVSGPETVVVTYTADGHRPFTLSVICDVHLQMGL